MAKKKRQVRANFRKNRTTPARDRIRADGLDPQDARLDDARTSQSVRGKGDLTRRRTVAGAEVQEDAAGSQTVLLEIDRSRCQLGRVLRVQGLNSTVQFEDGSTRRCATRRLLKTLATDQRHVVAAGDWAWVRPEGADEGIIERIEPRRGVLSRTSRGRQHVLVANVDQLLIIVSAAEPRLTPHLVDRYLVTAEKSGAEAVICINKIDLVDPAALQPLVGVYSQLGYRVLLLSAAKGWNIEALRSLTLGRGSVVAGQSGVGKSSLLNAIQPGLALRVKTVSAENQKGRHTTTTSELIPLEGGGYLVDTPGIRQFQLWDVIPAEVAGYFRDLRPFVSQCRYPDCTHAHEEPCAVKDAVADGYIDVRRYESYLQMLIDDSP
ncbi:MAG TPA: ribosome small subunit-dependent GTPase A [Lacipirellulaceae bacterium]|nr:ribosome small subunit-dependent GTPase A [Lacipirellulaceae bacterium]